MQKVAALQPESLDSLAGLAIDAVYWVEDYWHFFVALRCVDGKSVVFTSEDVQIAKYFEVFPVRVAVEETEQRPWRRLPHVETIARARALWRYEWLEPVEPHPELVGSGPHFVHRVGPSLPASSATQPVSVLAAVELSFASCGRAVVFSSDSAPLNVEFATEPEVVAARLAEFTGHAA